MPLQLQGSESGQQPGSRRRAREQQQPVQRELVRARPQPVSGVRQRGAPLRPVLLQDPALTVGPGQAAVPRRDLVGHGQHRVPDGHRARPEAQRGVQAQQEAQVSPRVPRRTALRRVQEHQQRVRPEEPMRPGRQLPLPRRGSWPGRHAHWRHRCGRRREVRVQVQVQQPPVQGPQRCHPVQPPAHPLRPAPLPARQRGRRAPRRTGPRLA